jgi:hypothetical protein
MMLMKKSSAGRPALEVGRVNALGGEKRFSQEKSPKKSPQKSSQKFSRKFQENFLKNSLKNSLKIL